MARIKRSFLTGIIILFFVGILILISNVLVSTTDKIWLPLFKIFSWEKYYSQSAIGGLLLTAVLAFFIGYLLTATFLERMLAKIPVLGKIWTNLQKTQKDIERFKNLTPVWLEFPLSGYGWIGFMTGVQKIKIIRKDWGPLYQKRVKIYIPNSPLPFTGQAMFVERPKIIGKILNPFDEVMKILISATAVSPQELIIEEWKEKFDVEITTD